MKPPLRIAIAGLGTVGGGVVKQLTAHPALLAARAGRAIEIVAVSARNPNKPRGFDLGAARFVGDATELARDPQVEVVVELIGGSEGVARALVEQALAAGKSVVTANKALIAHHGLSLATLAEKHGSALAFEAAVAGGIPIIKALRDGLAANVFRSVAGILNGTCNYILTRMGEAGLSFEDALAEAQSLGYAEAEPSFDVDGIDTAHKLAILASLAFGVAPDIEQVQVEGIRSITREDIVAASELGYVIKLLGVAASVDERIEQRVSPCMVRKHSPIGSVHGVFNAVMVEGDAVGRVFFEGRGAGEGPTASSVIADIIDIARGTHSAPLSLPVSALAPLQAAARGAHRGSYYVRLSVTDRPGVLAEVTQAFKEQEISLRSFLQHSHTPGAPVQLVITTHETSEAAMNQALAAISGQSFVHTAPHSIRIEAL